MNKKVANNGHWQSANIINITNVCASHCWYIISAYVFYLYETIVWPTQTIALYLVSGLGDNV